MSPCSSSLPAPVQTRSGCAPTLPSGQRVTAAPFGAAGGNGTWQEYVCVDEGALLAVPDGVSDEVGVLTKPL